MNTMLGASVGRKLVVALTGLFLVVFLVVHLAVNLTMLAGPETYNAVAHWMGSNPAILVLRPVLAVGLLIHIAWTLSLALANRRARPQRYAMVDPAGGSTWAARNMLVVGVVVLLFLALHIASIAFPITFGSPPETNLSGVLVADAYALVTERFGLWWYASLYAVAMVFLALHLAHGFQSALQTLGINNQRWRRRWTMLAGAYSIVVGVGFAALPVYFFVLSQMGSAS